MTTETAPTVAAPLKRDWRVELRDTLAAIPHKSAFGVLLLAWVLVFHFFGNSTQGYVKTPSLFAWLSYAYDMGGQDDSHGYMIPFVVLGFLWWKRNELAAARAKFWAPAITIAVIGLLLHLLGFAVQQTRLSVVGFYFGIWGLVGMVWGPEIMRRIFFPFLLFVFCVPLASATDTLTMPLRQLATTITVKICNLLSIAVQQNGTNILDPQQRYRYEVAAACSGIRSLTAIFALTSAYAFVFFTQTWKRAIVLFLAVPLAVISNVLRLLTIVFASEIAGAMGGSPQKAGEYVHDSSVISLLPYIVAFVGVLLVARRLKEDRDVDIVEVGIPVGVGIGISMVLGWLLHRGVQLNHENYATGGPARFHVMAPFLLVVVAMLFTSRNSFAALSTRDIAVSAAGLVLMGGSAMFLSQRQSWQRLSPPGVKVVAEALPVTETNIVLPTSVYLPPRVLSYESQAFPVAKVVYDWLPKDTTYGQRRYFGTNFFLDNIVVLMGADRTSIHKPQFCLTGQGFTIVSETTDHIPMSRPMPYDLPVKKIQFSGAVVQDGKRHEVGGVFVYWFVCDTEVSAEHNQRMRQIMFEMLRTGVMQRWAYVICMAPCAPGQEDTAYERVKEFIRAAVPEYQITTGKPLAETPRADAGK